MSQNQLPSSQTVTNDRLVNKRKRNYHPIAKLKEFLKKKYNNFHIGKGIFSETTTLLHRLELIDNTQKRAQIIAMCCRLNKKLGKFAKSAALKPHAFALNLSQKTSDKHYEKTLTNLQHNLDQLKDSCNNNFERRFIIRELKAF